MDKSKGTDYLNRKGFTPVTWDEFHALAREDYMAHLEIIANFFFKDCMVVSEGSFIEASDLFKYFESFCEWTNCWHVGRAVDPEWLANSWKKYADDVLDRDIQLGWIIFHEFVEEGAHLMILNVSVTVLDGMRDPNEPLFVTADYDPAANTIKVE